MTVLKRVIQRGGTTTVEDPLVREYNALKPKIEEAKVKKPGAIAAKIAALSNEVSSHITTGELGKARKPLENLTILVNATLGPTAPITPPPGLTEAQKDQKAWDDLKAGKDYKNTEAQIGDLEKWNVAEKTTTRAKFTALTTEATTNTNPKKACTDYPGVKTEVATAHAGRRALRLHDAEMAALASQFAAAEQVPGRGVDAKPELKEKWRLYDVAKNAVTAKKNMTDYAQLPGLRTAQKAAAEALMSEYKVRGTADPGFENWLGVRAQAMLGANTGLLQKASCVPLKTPALAQLRKEMDAAQKSIETNLGAGDIVKAEQAATEMVAKANALLTARGGTDKEEAKFYKEYRKIERWVDKALKEPHAVEPTKAAFADFKFSYDVFKNNWDQKKFKACLLVMRELKTKADAVMAETMKAATKSVTDVGALADGDPKAEAARTAINSISPEVLEEIPAKQKVMLLKALQSGAGVNRFNENDAVNSKNDPKRVAQRKVYAAMKMDEEFVKKDNETRKQLVDALKADPKIQKAKENWAIMSLEERKEAFQAVLDAQCKAFGFDKPPKGIEYYDFNVPNANPTPPPANLDLDPGDNGHFNPVGPPKGPVIRINTKAATFDDFELSVDLIAHENSHNLQDQLVKRTKLPDGDPKKIKADDKDPLFRQVQMFDSNDSPASTYVPGAEDYEIYRKQPLEEHAWYAGPKTAHDLIKALNS